MASDRRDVLERSDEDFNDASSISSSFDEGSARQIHSRNEAGPVASGGDNHTNLDGLIQNRIEKIYQRLEVTDINLHKVEELLRRQQQNNRESPSKNELQEQEDVRPGQSGRSSHSPERRTSISSQSSVEVFQHRRKQSGGREAIVKSADGRPGCSDNKSPTLEQLQRLTQSMQDLHNYQQRFQDTLRTEVLNRSSNGNSDIIRELSHWLRLNVEDSFRPKEILDKLATLQQDLKSTESRKQIDEVHSIQALENLRRDMDELRRTMSTLSVSSNKNEHFQKLSQLELQQLKLESNLEILAKHFDVWSQHSLGGTRCGRCESQEFNLQQQLNEAVRTSLDASRKVNQAADDLRRVAVDCTSDGLSNENDNVKEKAKKAIKKLKLKCDEFASDKERYRRRCQISEEKYQYFEAEKQALCTQLDKMRAEMMNAHKEQQDIKSNFFEEQRQGAIKEITIQRLNNVCQESDKCINATQQELKKSKSDIEKISLENTSLSQQVDKLKCELKDCKMELTSTNTTLELLKQSGSHAAHFKEKFEVSERHRNDVVSQLTKQIENEMESRVKVEKEVSELKHQITDLLSQINNMHQENKLLTSERGQLKGELLRVQAEQQQSTKKYEKLLRNFYSKNEELHSKLHRIDELDGNFTDYRKITHKMEAEYKAMLCNINIDVDRTMQLWNLSLDESLQAPASVSGVQCHPKVILVDIQSKLKWLQDDICLTSRSKMAQSKLMNNLGAPPSSPSTAVNIVDCIPARSSSPKIPITERSEDQLNILGGGTPDVQVARELTPINSSWDVSRIAKDTINVGDSSLLSELGFHYQKNNKQLNSTEAVSNLFQNRSSNRLQEIRDSFLSSLSEPSDLSSDS